MQNTASVQTSCTLCQRLHEPSAVDATHPICPHCAVATTRPPQPPFPLRPLAR